MCACVYISGHELLCVHVRNYAVLVVVVVFFCVSVRSYADGVVVVVVGCWS